jgi:hypothetical protein
MSYREIHSFLWMVDFQRDWCSLTTATVLAGRFAAEWCIYIWIWCKIWTFGLNHPNLSLAFDAVITGRDDVVHYYGVRDSSRTTTVLFWWSRRLTFITKLAYGVCVHLWRWLWTPNWSDGLASLILLSGFSALHGLLVISATYHALTLLETM